jgi:broad specificity phosphatase PhoE
MDYNAERCGIRFLTMTELYLLRHAQASFSSADYDALSDTGVDQSRLLGRYFADHGIDFDAMVTGTMLRHVQTLDVLAGELGSGSSTRSVHSGLDEYRFRSMISVFSEANPQDELVRALQERPQERPVFFRLLRRILTEWSEDRLPGAPENWSDFQQRVLDARAYLQALGNRCERILAVSSGGAISALIGSVLDLAPRHVFDLNLQLRNTSITRFFLGANGFRLAEFNTVPHLADCAHARLITYS